MVRSSFWWLSALLLCACVESKQVLFALESDAGDAGDAGAGDAGEVDAGGGSDAGIPARLFASALSAGDYHACAVVDSTLWCWGANSNGELGTNELGDRPFARQVGTGANWTHVVAGESSTCGLRGDGEVWCWGRNGFGEVARGDYLLQLTPHRVALPLPARHLSLYSTACVVLSDASLWCWGYNFEGQLGQNEWPPLPDATAPLPVAPGTTWTAVSNGQGHACGVQTSGELYCWGRNITGQTGHGPNQLYRVPTRVGTDSDWRTVACHQEGSCALKVDGSLWCWGVSHEAPFSERHDLVPTRVGADTDWVSVDAETFFTCGLKANGEVWCWGRGIEGELGTGDLDDRYVPGNVGDAGFLQVVSGRFFRCVRAEGGLVQCNGSNEHGQLGMGDFIRYPQPQDVWTQ